MTLFNQPNILKLSKLHIGLTGGIGCGKSTVLRYFGEAGARTVETDAIAKQLLDENADIQRALVARFGGDIIQPTGKVDRAKLASMVFADSRSLAYLESLVHPEVRRIWMEEISHHDGLIVVEIPLLFEKDLQTNFDLTVCVSCDPALQMQRLISRGMNPTQIEKRKQRQRSLEEKMQRADTIFFNNGSLEHLRDQVFTWLGSVAAERIET